MSEKKTPGVELDFDDRPIDIPDETMAAARRLVQAGAIMVAKYNGYSLRKGEDIVIKAAVALAQAPEHEHLHVRIGIGTHPPHHFCPVVPREVN